ncbi:putative membrane protein [Rossellomorea marisflavi]
MKSTRQFHTYIRGVILIGYALLLLKLLLTFNLQNFVALKMHGYLYFALGVFFLLGAVQIIRGTSGFLAKGQCGCEAHDVPKGLVRSIMVYALFVFPLITGFLLPDQLLDGSVAAKRGVKVGNGMFTLTPHKGERSSDHTIEAVHGGEATLDPVGTFPLEKDYDKLKDVIKQKEKIIVRDEQYIQTLSVVDEQLDSSIGKEIQLTGFIYKDEGFSKNEVVISRFTVTCCVADASVYGILSRSEELAALEPDTWVQVSGILDKADFNGVAMPVIKHPVFKKVEPPENPYVEEFYIKVE